ncbi:hypothetical protein IFM89_016097 [Coptis chinensis]|uniref:Surfeit locus protein 2 n=1 Tax=Coptis chinensis TaxID=261450 RepID=A0A835LUF3_9MAGN|nr:hypothetical protein IFM89_016097 [Coptis chinensis]
METVEKVEKEGENLLGPPTFTNLENGRFKCIETGHEMLAKDKDSYSNCKRCRLGLIDSALKQKKPPLNLFKQDPTCRLKLVCKLTGHIVNKSEEHIWKHINGKRFLNKLEQKEMEMLAPKKMEVEKEEEKVDKGLKKGKKNKDKRNKDECDEVDKEAMREKQPSDDDDVSELEEPDFWSPPVGSRWDFDDGQDRWDSDAESGLESDDENTIGAEEENDLESGDLSVRTKRMSIDIGPSSFASRKKKSRTKSSGDSSIA